MASTPRTIVPCAKCRKRFRETKETELLKAIRSDHVDCGKAAILRGADVKTTLIKAAEEGRLEWVNILVQAKADVNKQNEYGETALMKAAEKGDLKCIEFLTQADADVNELNYCGNTALMLAARNGHNKCVGILIEAGTDVNLFYRVPRLGFPSSLNEYLLYDLTLDDGSPTIPCPHCDRKFHAQIGLISHLKTHDSRTRNKNNPQ